MKHLYTLIFIFLVSSTITKAGGPPAHPYDDCGIAGDLQVIGSPYSGTTTGANNDFAFCTMGSAEDQIFYYDLPVGSTITINQTTNAYDSRHSLRYGGACPGTTEIVCTDDPDTRVESWQNCTGTIQRVYWIQSGFSANDGTYTLQWSVTGGTCPVPPSNDECSGAISLTVNPDQNCGSVTVGTVNLATGSTQNTASCGGTEDDDVWFSFVATNATHYIDLLNVAGSTTDLYHSVWTGVCPALTLVAGSCSDPNSSTVTGLTPGNTYYVRVYTWTSTPNQTTTFDICIGTPPPPPSNDDPCNATSATVNTGSTCTTLNPGYCTGATQSQAGCVGTADDDVWFSFTALAPQHDISILNATGTTDMVHELFSGPCASLTSIGCSDPNTSSYSGLTVGATYYVRVYTYSSTGNNTGFDLCITSPCGVSSTTPSCNLNYSYSTIAYNPQNYTTGNLITFSDDRYANAYTSLGFNFCFDGVAYQDVLVSSNGYLIFPGCNSAHPFGTRRAPSDYSPYSINAAAPNTTDAPVNAIMGTWHDIYPSSSAVDGEIRTQVTGTAPNRVFATKFYDVRMYSCTSQDYNGQILLYETTDNIEVHLGEKTVCSTFNSGAAIMGITDYTGTVASIPAGYNYPTQWTATNEGHRWASNCGICTVLPVELLSFSAKSFDDYNTVTWITESEINNDYFVLEKSNGGATFDEVATVKGAGNSNTTLTYSLNHKNSDEIIYYRLRQVDFDGKMSYSKIIPLRRKKTTSYEFYPNPSSDKLYFEISKSKNEVYTIEYINILGSKTTETITLTKGKNTFTLQLFESLDNGIYFINIINSQGEILKTSKVVKQ